MEHEVKDYYSMLNVRKGASSEEIKKSFAGLAKDNTDNIPALKEYIEAYKVLSDPEARKEYDKELKAKKKPKFSLKRERKAGKTNHPIRKIGKRILIGGAIVAVVTPCIIQLSSWFGVQNKKDEKDEKPKSSSSAIGGFASSEVASSMLEEVTSSQVTSSTSTIELEAATQKVYENWSKIGVPYSKEEISEMIKCLNDIPSTVNMDTAIEMLESALNIALVPAVNNSFAGETVSTPISIDLASAILPSDPAYKGVNKINDIMNEAFTGSDMQGAIKEGLKFEARILAEEANIDGFERLQSSHGSHVVCAACFAGINGVAGSLGEDYIITGEALTYSTGEPFTYPISDIIDNKNLEAMIDFAKGIRFN